MKPEFIFLTVLAVIGVLIGISLIYITLKYPYEFKDDLKSDIILTIINFILLVIVVIMGVK